MRSRVRSVSTAEPSSSTLAACSGLAAAIGHDLPPLIAQYPGSSRAPLAVIRVAGVPSLAKLKNVTSYKSVPSRLARWAWITVWPSSLLCRSHKPPSAIDNTDPARA